jgi:hypothetical protein
MKYDYLRQYHPKDRPKMLPVWGNEYFMNWKYLRWFMLSSLPGIMNAFVLGFAFSKWKWSIFGFIVSQYLIMVGFVFLCSGMCSSNWGTYFKEKEPEPYWNHIKAIIGAYILVMCLMWFGK